MFENAQKLLVCVSILVFICVNSYAQDSRTFAAINNIPTFTDDELIARLSAIDNEVIKPKFTNAVKGYIRTYAVRRREHSENVVGKTVMYFPMFEKTLKEHRMPTDLKYLAIVESGLNAEAYSRAGAAGLWQFMKGTGREFDLIVNKIVDERMDPIKSTDAAARYLRQLYSKYNDWALALAAYNSGPGRVNKAIRKGRSKNFWVIQRYLPKETRNYVPGFIAAAYLMNYYDEHNIVPTYPEYDLQITETTKIYQKMTFDQIQNITGVSYETIKKLNPSFRKNYIPSSSKGYNFTLPYHSMSALMNFIDRPDSAPRNVFNGGVIFTDDSKFKTEKATHKVKLGENLVTIAKQYDCQDYHIVTWNGLRTPYLVEGQELIIYQKVSRASIARRALIARPKVVLVEALPSLNSPTLKIENHQLFTEEAPDLRPFKVVKHVFKKGDNLKDISKKYNSESVFKILEYNDIESLDELKPGKLLKIKKFKK